MTNVEKILRKKERKEKNKQKKRGVEKKGGKKGVSCNLYCIMIYKEEKESDMKEDENDTTWEIQFTV